MSKLVKEASNFFQKNRENVEKEFQRKDVSTNFLSVSLNQDEQDQIESLIINHYEDLGEPHSEALNAIKLLTSQIKSIQKQHVLLLGEKIYRVREILQRINSPETTFSQWINIVFHTKSSAYNALAYYELFISLPDSDTKTVFQSIPYKTAYLLASRKGTLEDKVKVLGEIRGMSNTSAIHVLNRHLPSSRSVSLHLPNYSEDRNKIISNKLIEVLNLLGNGLELSSHNINLLQQLFEATLEKEKEDQKYAQYR
ncbi:hypothetical protein CP10139811_1550 [Chlamydia ibidis]|uniref:Virulence plasmid protein pGP6-D-related protein n=1 Tax=Chlamydia ibidis TaxID=1405396 RepID=S7J5I1_9CHLA|nr:CT583 family protein [Chlamydia ibidis]EPP35488.1 hypothetical protein CP10139811_1550 [Chlamydia ibidis]